MDINSSIEGDRGWGGTEIDSIKWDEREERQRESYIENENQKDWEKEIKKTRERETNRKMLSNLYSVQ